MTGCAGSIRRIWRRIWRRSWTRWRRNIFPVLLTGMYAPPNLGPDYQKAFRAVFDRLGKRPGVLYDPFFLEGVAMDPDLIQADHLHPNAEGVKREVARILPIVEQLLAEVRPA